MRFWDSSGLVPLVVSESASASVRGLLAEDRELVLWWSALPECVSALQRKRRAGELQAAALESALAELRILAQEADEVLPAVPIRERALRLLAVHALGAAGALQLSAALAWARERLSGRALVTLDGRLREAGRREGFHVLPEGIE